MLLVAGALANQCMVLPVGWEIRRLVDVDVEIGIIRGMEIIL